MMFLIMALAFCVISLFLSAVAVGIGFLLAACVTGLQLGSGIIAGAVIGAASLFFIWRLFVAAAKYQDDDNGLPDDHPGLVFPRDFLHRSLRRSKPREKKK